MREPSIPPKLIVNNFIDREDISRDLQNQELGMNQAQTQAAEPKHQTNDLITRIDKLSERTDDLMLTREFNINLYECFQQYPQFTNSASGKLKPSYQLPIRAYCPEVYCARNTKNKKFLREIHIIIDDENLNEYTTEYDFNMANDILRSVIQEYKTEKRMRMRIRIIAKDWSDDGEYWYLQLQVTDNQECIDLAKQIANKRPATAFKQPIRGAVESNPISGLRP